MELPNWATAVVLFGGFVFVMGLTKGRIPEKEGQTQLKPTSSTYIGSRHNDDKPDADLTVWSPSGERWDCSLYPDGLLYEPKGRGTKAGPPGPSQGSGAGGEGSGSPGGEEAAGASGDGGEKAWRYELKLHRYTDDWSPDLGAWGGFRVDSETGGGRPDIGVRYSPVRFLDGVLAPDILLSPFQAGLGASFYMPSQTSHGTWRHLGVGLGYAVEFGGSRSGWLPYLSLSTRF